LNEALAGSSEVVRQKILWNPLRLIKSGDLATPGVRELLQEATSNREPQLRIEGHLALMNRSQENASHLAATLSFVALRYDFLLLVFFFFDHFVSLARKTKRVCIVLLCISG
jgi:hypothetical protein